MKSLLDKNLVLFVVSAFIISYAVLYGVMFILNYLFPAITIVDVQVEHVMPTANMLWSFIASVATFIFY